ncbi:MAG: hypothetical protein OXN83_05315 [Oligoflexia bacterium]|nr:hypothetical protein [Oligoflexia bacterium]
MKASIILIFFLFFQISCNKNTEFQSLSSQSQSFNSNSPRLKNLEQEHFQIKNKKPLLDILVIADTSGSMYHHLSQLGHSLSDLLFVISDYDWQIGITSADHGDHINPRSLQQNWRDQGLGKKPGRFGSLMNLENGNHLLNTKILSPKITHYEQVFLHSLSHIPKIDCDRPPYCSNYLEQPLRSLQTAINRSLLDNQDFFRPQADFISLIITNEEERKEDQSRATTAEEVRDSFSQYFSQLNKKFIAYNIIVTDSSCLDSERSKGGVAEIAHSIAKLAELTGGFNISLCSQNYSSELRKISQHIKHQIENVVSLKTEPFPDSVQVHFLNGPHLKWSLSGKDIIFESKSDDPTYGVITYQDKTEIIK